MFPFGDIRSLITLSSLIQGLAPRKHFRVLEIGSGNGFSANVIIESFAMIEHDFLEIVCVDSWYRFTSSNTNINSYPYSRVIFGEFNHKTFANNTNKLNEKTNLIEIIGTSETSLKYMESQSFDLIFVDGLHTEVNALNDIRHAKRLCKYDGIVCGDDYDTDHEILQLLESQNIWKRGAETEEGVQLQVDNQLTRIHPGVATAVHSELGIPHNVASFWAFKRNLDSFESINQIEPFKVIPSTISKYLKSNVQELFQNNRSDFVLSKPWKQNLTKSIKSHQASLTRNFKITFSLSIVAISHIGSKRLKSLDMTISNLVESISKMHIYTPNVFYITHQTWRRLSTLKIVISDFLLFTTFFRWRRALGKHRNLEYSIKWFIKFLVSNRLRNSINSRRNVEGQIIVTAKHLKSLEYFLESKDEKLIVLEDDAIFNTCRKEMLSEVLYLSDNVNGRFFACLSSGWSPNLEWEGLAFSEKELSKLKLIEFMHSPGVYILNRPVVNLACAYLINRRFVEEFCAFIQTRPLMRFLPIDWLFIRFFSECKKSEGDQFIWASEVIEHGSESGMFQMWRKWS